MPHENFVKFLRTQIDELEKTGTTKGAEQVVVKVKRAKGERGPRYRLAGYDKKKFISHLSHFFLD